VVENKLYVIINGVIRPYWLQWTADFDIFVIPLFEKQKKNAFHLLDWFFYQYVD
jgi:hypothetical protein